MENLKRFVLNNQDKFKYLVFAGIGLAGFNCLTRPDFNLIIYLYIYYLWFIMTENRVSILISIGNSIKRKNKCIFLPDL